MIYSTCIGSWTCEQHTKHTPSNNYAKLLTFPLNRNRYNLAYGFVNPSWELRKPWHHTLTSQTHSPYEVLPPVHFIVAEVKPILSDPPSAHPTRATTVCVP